LGGSAACGACVFGAGRVSRGEPAAREVVLELVLDREVGVGGGLERGEVLAGGDPRIVGLDLDEERIAQRAIDAGLAAAIGDAADARDRVLDRSPYRGI